MTLKKQITTMKRMFRNCVLFEGANVDKINFTNAMLKNDNLATVPDDYCELLRITNGFLLPPFEFYGTENVKRTSGNYVFPNIVEANKIFVKNGNPLIQNRVVLGAVFFDVIVFDAIDGKYKILNRLDFGELVQFENVGNILDYVSERV